MTETLPIVTKYVKMLVVLFAATKSSVSVWLCAYYWVPHCMPCDPDTCSFASEFKYLSWLLKQSYSKMAVAYG